jgi:hypothetical protein
MGRMIISGVGDRWRLMEFEDEGGEVDAADEV